MAKTANRTRKHFLLDAAKLERAQKAHRAKTKTEAIEFALDLVIAKHQNDRQVRAANERFI